MVAVARPLVCFVLSGYGLVGHSLVARFHHFLAIMLGLFTVLAAILQGLFNNRLAIQEMLIGLAVKVIVQWPMIFFFNVYGPVLSTMLGHDGLESPNALFNESDVQYSCTPNHSPRRRYSGLFP